jgi:cell division transport system ATP-binding protein
MIFFNKVTKIYPARSDKKQNIIFKESSFKVDKGEFVLVTGKSGSGKTTLFKLITGEEKPTDGKVFFDGQDVGKFKAKNIYKLRRRIGIIFQDYKLLDSKNIYNNLSCIMESLGFKDEQIIKNIPELLDVVGLSGKAHHYPSELSGGEKQRVAIARALISSPDVILADEPTGNIDPYYTIDIVNLLSDINRKGTTVIFATHDKEIINKNNRRVITIKEGGVVRDELSGKFRL